VCRFGDLQRAGMACSVFIGAGAHGGDNPCASTPRKSPRETSDPVRATLHEQGATRDRPFSVHGAVRGERRSAETGTYFEV
jgi:hypothetical protein